ncbi:SDR family oxidoreductase [Aquimarina sp. U1-2]|uniref:SDR family NAD(P)-dependent oxidoreductase n=1 Tax=Aquimarina sp. U1-2 TaxID=2823141 RepID=UPI001AECC4F0|nr:SDR family NAD(P)-dependent oxidoreductase [Aquimarina sp. U1-2]MBP2831856.1 SDR family oxidoreductase [Aquimarina sp. U1-2]
MDKKTFEEKTVLVTGSTSGMGKSAALLFAKQGAKVVVTGRRKEKGEKVVEQIKKSGGEATFFQMDLRKKDSIKETIESTVEKYGKIDVLLANAGAEQPTTAELDGLPDEEIDMIIETNLLGTIYSIKYALPHLKKPGASICTVSSMYGLLGNGGVSIYSLTKGGIIMFTKSLAVEQGQHGIRVNCIAPGVIDTEMLQRYTQGKDMSGYYKANVPLGEGGNADEVARVMVFISSDEAAYISGQVLAVDGGITSKMSNAALPV